MRIQHNVMAMNAYRNYTNNVSAMKANLEKLSSGYKINRAGDDAAGLAISEKMRAQITGLQTAQKNAKDGISLVQTAEGALTEVHDMLNRMVELATQSANGTYDNDTDRYQLQKEMDQLKSEINRIADSSNFNGIKLLDGSLATSGAAGGSSIKIGGSVNGQYSTGAAGVFDTDTAITAGILTTAAGAGVGDTFQYGVNLSDGTGYTVTLTVKKDADDKFYLEGDSGAKYKLAANAATTVKAEVSELADAIKGELQKTALADQYVIGNGATTGQFKFTAKEQGTSTPAILAADFGWTDASNAAANRTPGTKVGITVTTQARDVGYEIDASKITEYNGKNYDDAVFTINGKKFVVLTEGHSAADLGTATSTPNQIDMNVAAGLGDDVTILVGGVDGLKSTNGNFQQNIAKIAEVTGLTVTDAVGATADAVDGNTVYAQGGIRLSAGKGSITGGLVLQIGDTADSYNQLRVGIDDCHTKALGLDNISIANQDDAALAIDAIKRAINKVSDVRGTLGATQNRLDHTINNLSVMTENIQDAESTIRDTDVAEEMMAYTKNNILIQSAQAMLAQANQVPQGVLQLLQ